MECTAEWQACSYSGDPFMLLRLQPSAKTYTLHGSCKAVWRYETHKLSDHLRGNYSYHLNYSALASFPDPSQLLCLQYGKAGDPGIFSHVNDATTNKKLMNTDGLKHNGVIPHAQALSCWELVLRVWKEVRLLVELVGEGGSWSLGESGVGTKG